MHRTDTSEAVFDLKRTSNRQFYTFKHIATTSVRKSAHEDISKSCISSFHLKFIHSSSQSVIHWRQDCFRNWFSELRVT